MNLRGPGLPIGLVAGAGVIVVLVATLLLPADAAFWVGIVAGGIAGAAIVVLLLRSDGSKTGMKR